jgi:hypothetical protein
LRKGSAIVPGETEDALATRQPWSRDEVDLIVVDYFLMLRAELAGEPCSEADHNNELRPLLDNRSKQAVELQHQNISAVLVEMGLPYIDGYKPARNDQKSILPQAVEDYLIRHPGFFDTLTDGAILNPPSLPRIEDRPVSELLRGSARTNRRSIDRR